MNDEQVVGRKVHSKEEKTGKHYVWIAARGKWSTFAWHLEDTIYETADKAAIAKGMEARNFNLYPKGKKEKS